MKRKDIKFIILAIASVAGALLWLSNMCVPASYIPVINWLIERTN